MIYFMIISTNINSNILNTTWENQEKYEKEKETKGKQEKNEN